eukprot:2115763-Pleurochrysis_carterae.AAC.1
MTPHKGSVGVRVCMGEAQCAGGFVCATKAAARRCGHDMSRFRKLDGFLKVIRCISLKGAGKARQDFKWHCKFIPTVKIILPAI